MRTVSRSGSVVLGALALTVGVQPVAHGETDTAIESLSAPASVRVGDPVAAGGRVVFGVDRQVIATDPAGDVSSAHGAAGMDLTGLTIATDPEKPAHLVWTFQVAGLPPAIEGTPEAVFYWWRFTVPGGEELALDARRTNAYRQLSANPFFRVRRCPGGSCTDVDTPSGAFDQPAGEVRAILKVGRIPGAEPGAALGMGTVETSLGTGARWVYGLGDHVLPDREEYVIPFADVRAGLALPGRSVPRWTAATVDGEASDRTFDVAVPTSGWSAGTYDLVVRACWGANCATARRPVQLT